MDLSLEQHWIHQYRQFLKYGHLFLTILDSLSKKTCRILYHDPQEPLNPYFCIFD